MRNESRASRLLARVRPVVSLVGNRLVQFLVLGGILFRLSPDSSRAVRFDAREIQAILDAHARRNGAGSVEALPADEKREVVGRLVLDEVLYQEALRLGLDKSDHIVRNRLVQKMQVLAEDLSGDSLPVDAVELGRYFEKHREEWRQPPAIRFQHVFFEGRPPVTLDAIRKLGKNDSRRVASLGNAFPLRTGSDLTPVPKIVAELGPEFAGALETLPEGEWQGPVRSKFGLHFVKVTRRRAGRVPTLVEVEKDVRLAYTVHRKTELTARYFRELFRQYAIAVPGYHIAELEPTPENITARPQGGE